MGQFVISSPEERRFLEAEQVVVAVGEKTDSLFLRRSAIEVHQVIAPGRKETGKNAHVKIGARRRIAVGELGPAKIALVFGTNEPSDMARMPAERKQDADNAANTGRAEKEIVRLLDHEPAAVRPDLQRDAIIGLGPALRRLVFLRIEIGVEFA